MDAVKMLEVITKKAEAGDPSAISALAGILTAMIHADPGIVKSLKGEGGK